MEAEMRGGTAACEIGFVIFVGVTAGFIAASMKTGRMPAFGDVFSFKSAPGSNGKVEGGLTETTGLGNPRPEVGPIRSVDQTSASDSKLPPQPLAVGCSNPKGIGISRMVEIDTTGGPGFGFEHFKTYDFLRPGEVVLTFDDGPWPRNTPAVLAALAEHCTKATFFPIGKHATYHPEILRQVAAAGHTIGSHPWGHLDLCK